ncbi:hypothetical protein [Rhizobium phage RHph_X2_24]|nr:hypothetical protein [Rhizobium phage RHph_X2_24]
MLTIRELIEYHREMIETIDVVEQETGESQEDDKRALRDTISYLETLEKYAQ